MGIPFTKATMRKCKSLFASGSDHPLTREHLGIVLGYSVRLMYEIERLQGELHFYETRRDEDYQGYLKALAKLQLEEEKHDA